MTGTYQHQDVNYKALNGWTPLTLAVFHGKLDCVETLVKRLVLQRPKMGLHPYICFKFAWKMEKNTSDRLSPFSLLCDCNFGKYAPFSRKFTWMHKCGRLTGDKWYIMRQWICVFSWLNSRRWRWIYIYTVHYIYYIYTYVLCILYNYIYNYIYRCVCLRNRFCGIWYWWYV